MLKDFDLARLNTKLQVPLIVQDILDGHEVLNGDAEYGLHEILSDYQPDSALLSIAFSGHKIASRFEECGVSMAVLKMECELMIADYAGLWMDHAKSQPIDHTLLMDTLADIPSDLESLAELLESTRMILEAQHPHAANLCEILLTQARAQALIAEAFIETIDKADHSPAPKSMPAAMPPKSNVIPFPYYARG